MGTPCWADGAACPGAAELIAQLHGGGAPPAYGLPAPWARRMETARPLPPLAAEVRWRPSGELYGTVIGVEELSEQLRDEEPPVMTFKQEIKCRGST